MTIERTGRPGRESGAAQSSQQRHPKASGHRRHRHAADIGSGVP